MPHRSYSQIAEIRKSRRYKLINENYLYEASNHGLSPPSPAVLLSPASSKFIDSSSYKDQKRAQTFLSSPSINNNINTSLSITGSSPVHSSICVNTLKLNTNVEEPLVPPADPEPLKLLDDYASPDHSDACLESFNAGVFPVTAASLDHDGPHSDSQVVGTSHVDLSPVSLAPQDHVGTDIVSLQCAGVHDEAAYEQSFQNAVPVDAQVPNSHSTQVNDSTARNLPM